MPTEEKQQSAHPYDALTPDVILDAVETYGLRCTGELLALNSYENRVYRIGTEDAVPVAAKFYRPNRWPDAAILEEHAFTAHLAEHEIPVVAPLTHPDGATLSRHASFRFTLFPWQPGRAPELNKPEDYTMLGRYLGRMHRLGMAQPFAHRPTLTIEAYGKESAAFLLVNNFIPAHLETAFRSLTDQLLAAIEASFAVVSGNVQQLRLHGDCHLSNILWTHTGPHIVDFDDCRMGPAVQDLWMLLAGETGEKEKQLGDILDGYTQFCEFNPLELQLIEPLRTLRLLHYSAWLARRWTDPAFPRNFPWFNTIRYWEEQILTLREQQAMLQEPALVWHQ